MQSMRYMAMLLSVIRTLSVILIRVMSKQGFFQEKSGEKSVRQKRYVMQAIMMISTLPVEKNPNAKSL